MQCSSLSADQNWLAEVMLQSQPLSSIQQNPETIAVNMLLETQVVVVSFSLHI